MTRDIVAERLTELFGDEFAPSSAPFDLAPLRAALDAIGAPHLMLPPTIHVAGTNGKGSTIAFMRAIGEAAGLRVHVFSKPHLVQTLERMRLAGELVSGDAFIGAIERVSATGARLRHFEGQVAAAFLLFAETPADLLILETGVGGRCDATNVIERPALCVLTPIDIDHAELLGRTLTDIAREKAGILKPRAVAVVARQRPEALGAIEESATSNRVQLFRHGVEWGAFSSHSRMAVQTEHRLYDLPAPSLVGAHQIDNAGAAVVAMSLLGGSRIDENAMARGVRDAFIPARMQRVPLERGPSGPLFNRPASRECAPEGARSESVRRPGAGGPAEIWIDGAHNPHGARAIAAALHELHTKAPRPVILIVGMLKRKDAAGFLAALRGSADLLLTTPVAGKDCISGEELMQLASAQGFDAVASRNLQEAIDAAAVRAPNARVVICGSLALAAEALALSDRLG